MAKYVLSVLIVAIFLISIGFYFTQNIEEKRKSNTRMVLVAFLLPFSNMLLFIASNFISSKFLFSDSFDSLGYALSGSIYMIIIVPLCVIFSWIFYLITKNSFYIKTASLTFLLGAILIFVTVFFVFFIDEARNNIVLNKYEPVIQSIEKYRKEKGYYPPNLSLIGIDEKIYPSRYESESDKRDYVISVCPYHHCFYYCSSQKHDGCYPKEGYPIKYIQHGKWIEAINQD